LSDVSLLLSRSDIQKAGEEGAIVDLMPYLKNGDMPNYQKFLEQHDNLAEVEDSGHLYFFSDGLYSDSSTNYATQQAWLFRFDQFKKNNIPIPQTLQQLYTDAVKLKKLYPKSYPVGSENSGLAQSGTLDNVFATMNHTNTGFYFNGSKYEFGPVNDYNQFEDTIKYMNKLYTAGLIDPNFLTIQSSQFSTLADTGEFSIVPNGWALQAMSSGQGLNVKGFNGQWGTAAPPKNLNGQVSWKMGTDSIPGFSASPGWGIVISSKAKNIPELVKLLDYQYSPQMVDLYNFGIEGQTYTTGKDGNPQFLPQILNVPAGQSPSDNKTLASLPVDPGGTVRIGIQWIPQSRAAESQLYGEVPVYMSGKYFSADTTHFSSISAGGVASINPNDFAPTLPLTSEQTTEIANIQTNVTNYEKEHLADFITGKESFADWGTFIKNLQAQGDIQKVLNMDNAALAQYEKSTGWTYQKAIGVTG
jgi:putative aldouronate transport system substrate-binding protein